MREIRPSGSEGGVALTPPSLPLSLRWRQWHWPVPGHRLALARSCIGTDRDKVGRRSRAGPLYSGCCPVIHPVVHGFFGIGDPAISPWSFESKVLPDISVNRSAGSYSF